MINTLAGAALAASGTKRLKTSAIIGIIAALTTAQLARAENKFLQHNLVSDLPGLADVVDSSLVNPWGISSSPTSPFWIANNHSGTATVYDSAGKPAPLVVTVRQPGGAEPLAPTGQVFNGTSGFVLPGGKPAVFLFSTEDGIISGWYNGIANNEAVIAVSKGGSAVYKGLAIGTTQSGPALYAPDFRGGTVDVYSADFSLKAVAGAFTDTAIPEGFAPFNVYVSGERVYVAYARQDEDKEDDQPGDGNGFINVFDVEGHLLQRLVSGGRLNSPWGMVIAPDDFGDFGRALLVGNFGDGTINAYDTASGEFLGTLQGANGRPIVNPGLWALQFGNGAAGGDSNALYFTAGISGPAGDAIETHGLFGSIQAAPAIRADGVVNGAGFQTAIAPNGWVTIFGKNLAATTRSWKDSDFVNDQLPTQLGGVSVMIDGKPAYVAYISPAQLNVLAAAAATPGPVMVQSKNGDLTSAAVTADMQPAAPALFTADKYAITTHEDGTSRVESGAPAEAGSVITLYGTGFGMTDPPAPEGRRVTSPHALVNPATILIDGIRADVTFAGLVSPGLYQFNVKVPDRVNNGDVPVAAELAGSRSPEAVFIPAKAAAPATPPQPSAASAQIDNFQFMPPTVNLATGAELTWTNKQAIEHTVVSNDGKFGSGVLEQNGTFSFKFTTPGTYGYHCSIHPFMKGTVVVQ